jgi:Uma2 family endonuclease
MVKSPQREINKKLLARLLELWAVERNVPLYGYGETTLRDDLERAGLEPDECYTLRRPLHRVPDLAIEVVVTRKALNKLRIYETLGVGEVWILEKGALTVHVLGRRGYKLANASALLPALDLELLARHAAMPDQHRAVMSYRDALRGKRRRVRQKRR